MRRLSIRFGSTRSLPVLTKRFPDATQEQLNEAHAYAYGGCIIQDLGYYPFGSHFYSDLAHYVRSARSDSVVDRRRLRIWMNMLLRSAPQRITARMWMATRSPSTSRSRYFIRSCDRSSATMVTYADNPAAHLKTEFGFDVLQVARGHYAPKAYHDFIGFAVSKELAGPRLSGHLWPEIEGAVRHARPRAGNLPVLREYHDSEHDQSGLGAQKRRRSRKTSPQFRGNSFSIT